MQAGDSTDKRAILSKHFLFSRLGDAELDRILAFAKERRYSDRQLIFQKGDEGTCMMVVLQGQVRISVSSAEGKEIILNRLGPGDMFGEIALIDGKERSADASAEGGCDLLLLLIYRRDFLAYLSKHPEVAIELLNVLCGKLRDTSDMAESMGLLSIPCRLARLLNSLAEHQGEETPEGIRVDMDMSQREMGCLIGATRESVNKCLRAWQAKGLMMPLPNSIIILDADALDDIASVMY